MSDINLAQEAITEAALQEEKERLEAENLHYKKRVVLLRALVNHLQRELAELKGEDDEENSEEEASEEVSETDPEKNPGGDSPE